MTYFIFVNKSLLQLKIKLRVYEMNKIVFLFLFGFSPSYAQPVTGYHAILFWAPWFDLNDSSTQTFTALKNLEDLNENVRWIRTQTHLNPMIPFKAKTAQAFSFQNSVRDVMANARTFDGPAVIDLVIQSHGDTNRLSCHDGYTQSDISHRELKSFLVSVLKDVSPNQELKLRLFLDYCSSGGVIEHLKKSTWPKHITFEVYTSTDGEGVSYGSTLAPAIAATTLLLSAASETFDPRINAFNAYFNMFGRFFFASKRSGDHNPIQTWSSAAPNEEILKSHLLKVILGFFKGKNRFERHLDLVAQDHIIDIVFASIERANNEMAQQLFWGEPPSQLSRDERVDYQILQVRHFFDAAPGSKATLSELLDHTNSEVRYIAILTLGEYLEDLSEPPFKGAVDLLYKTYWSEVDRANSSHKNLKLIVDHLSRLKNRSARARQIHQDWTQRACQNLLVNEGYSSRSARSK